MKRRLITLPVILLLVLSAGFSLFASREESDSEKTPFYDFDDVYGPGSYILKRTGTVNLKVGETADFSAQMTFPYIARGISWSSDHPEIASVSAIGAVKALSRGTCEITATYEDQSGHTRKNVVVVHVTDSSDQKVVPAWSFALAEHERVQLSGMLFPGAKSGDVTYSVSDGTVAEVDENGVLTGVKFGHCTLEATHADGRVREAEVRVRLSTDMLDYQHTITLSAGETVDVRTMLHPRYNSFYGDVTFRSSEDRVAAVNGSGVLTAKTAGVCIITVTHTPPDRDGTVTTRKLYVRVTG